MPLNYALDHPKWSLITHLVRFRRAEGKCERCPCVHLKPHRRTGHRVILAIVRLDHDRTKNNFSDLAAFCQWCHLWWDCNHYIYSRKYGRETLYQNGVLFSIQPSPVSIPRLSYTPTLFSLFDQDTSDTLSLVSLFDIN